MVSPSRAWFHLSSLNLDELDDPGKHFYQRPFRKNETFNFTVKKHHSRGQFKFEKKNDRWSTILLRTYDVFKSRACKILLPQNIDQKKNKRKNREIDKTPQNQSYCTSVQRSQAIIYFIGKLPGTGTFSMEALPSKISSGVCGLQGATAWIICDQLP